MHHAVPGTRALVALLLSLVLAAACAGAPSVRTTSTPADAAVDEPYAMARAEPGDDEPTLFRLRHRGSITVGTKVDQPLFGLRDPADGTVSGLDAEMARLVALRLFGADDPRHLRFVEVRSADRETYLQERRVDLVTATYTINTERRKLVDFAGPYFVAGQDVLVPRSDTTTRSVEDLDGLRVCTAPGSTSLANVVRLAPTADIRTADNYSLCIDGMRSDLYDAVTTDNAILLGYVDESPQEWRLVGEPFTVEGYGIGVALGQRDLCRFVTETLRIAAANGDWERAYRRSVGRTAVSVVPSPPPLESC